MSNLRQKSQSNGPFLLQSLHTTRSQLFHTTCKKILVLCEEWAMAWTRQGWKMLFVLQDDGGCGAQAEEQWVGDWHGRSASARGFPGGQLGEDGYLNRQHWFQTEFARLFEHSSDSATDLSACIAWVWERWKFEFRLLSQTMPITTSDLQQFRK